MEDYKEKIIITMTSWRKRLANIPDVLDTVFKQTIKPDKIVINLSSEEFPDKEKEIPAEVLEYINKREAKRKRQIKIKKERENKLKTFSVSNGKFYL